MSPPLSGGSGRYSLAALPDNKGLSAAFHAQCNREAVRRLALDGEVAGMDTLQVVRQTDCRQITIHVTAAL